MPKKYYHYQREGEDKVLEEGLLKVPSFHLTGAETMKFIKEAHIRAKEKEAKQKEKEEIKTKALKEAQKQKWKQKQK